MIIIKTMREHFFSRNPDAPRAEGDIPLACPWMLGYDDYREPCAICDAVGGCDACWNRPFERPAEVVLDGGH